MPRGASGIRVGIAGGPLRGREGILHAAGLGIADARGNCESTPDAGYGTRSESRATGTFAPPGGFASGSVPGGPGMTQARLFRPAAGRSAGVEDEVELTQLQGQRGGPHKGVAGGAGQGPFPLAHGADRP